jgi:hypothetical protein
MAKNLGKIGGSYDFQSKWINFIASKFIAKNLGKIGGSHDFQSKWINFIASKCMAKNLGKIGGSYDFQSKWINFIASKFMAKFFGKIGGSLEGSHDFQSKWINFIASKYMAKNSRQNRGYVIYQVERSRSRLRETSIAIPTGNQKTPNLTSKQTIFCQVVFNENKSPVYFSYSYEEDVILD